MFYLTFRNSRYIVLSPRRNLRTNRERSRGINTIILEYLMSEWKFMGVILCQSDVQNILMFTLS